MRLLPQRPEALPDGQARDPAPEPPPGSTLSLYPSITRTYLVRVLAVLALYAVVRNNIASEASLRRLSIAALANGATLVAISVYVMIEAVHRFQHPTKVAAPLMMGIAAGGLLLERKAMGRQDPARLVGRGAPARARELVALR